LTNFSEIKKRLARVAELKKQFSTAGLEVYTKQERARFQKELTRLETAFSSIATLTGLPAAVFVVDAKAEKIAVAEARTLGLPVVSISGTDCDLGEIDYPVVANDNSAKTIEWILRRLATAHDLGRQEQQEQEREKALAETAVTDDQHQTN
ncbi:MAG: 30S ribosomal protein S2, partial [Patescibacteria group bacterium]